MPVATLTFALPEEQDEHSYAVAAVDLVIALKNFDDRLRQRVKYGERSGQTIGTQEARDWLHEELGNLVWMLD